MKPRRSELIEHLKRYTTPQTSAQLSSALNVSVRSVKNYIKEINAGLPQPMIYARRDGYQLSQFMSRPSPASQNIPQTQAERGAYIIKRLIEGHPEGLNLFVLCDELAVSYSTLKATISLMNSQYDSYQVKFRSVNNHLVLWGEDKDKRKFISRMIYQSAESRFLDVPQLKSWFQSIDVDGVSQLVLSTARQFNYYINHLSFVDLLLHLLLIIDQDIYNQSISCQNKLESSPLYPFLEALIARLEACLSHRFSDYGKNEIDILFSSSMNYSKPEEELGVSNLIGTDMLELTDEFIKKVDQNYMVNLSSRAFRVSFSIHLKNLLLRAKENRHVVNPMLDLIRSNSPILFDIAVFIGLELIRMYGIKLTDDEYSFLAMHIGAEIERQNHSVDLLRGVLLCPDYHALHVTISNQLMIHFGNKMNLIEIVHQEDDIKESGFDLLFSTVPISRFDADWVILISPFDIHKQFEQINQRISTIESHIGNFRLKETFDKIFDRALFDISDSLTTPTDVIHHLCGKLETHHYVDRGYEEQVLKRENAISTAFGNLAIPHAVEMSALKTGIAVLVSKAGIKWGGTIVHFVLLMALNKNDYNIFRDSYESLISIFNDDKTFAFLKHLDSFDAFKRMIQNY